MGGAQAGELASRLAAAAVGRAETTEGSGRDRVIALIQAANRSVYERSTKDAEVAGMGTTITVALVENASVTFGHVGDSRLYRLTPGGQLLRETEDHSVVEEEVRAGRMTPEQAANHPSKNVISRALGAENDVEVDMKTIEVEEGPG